MLLFLGITFYNLNSLSNMGSVSSKKISFVGAFASALITVIMF